MLLFIFLCEREKTCIQQKRCNVPNADDVSRTRKTSALPIQRIKIMANSPNPNKRKLGCSLFPNEIQQLKELAAERDITVTELLRKIALGAIGLAGDPEFDALEHAPVGKERPNERPMNAKPIDNKRAIKPLKRTQNPFPQRVRVRVPSPVVFG